MNNKTKLILALMQVENISSLMEGNEWQQFINSKLIGLKVELERQLSNETVKELSQTP
jgi:hypothetical protein